MPNDFDPRLEQWYARLDKGQRFFITAVDTESEAIEVQHFDGDLEEFSFEEWRDLDIELSEAPENWTGALDIAEKDDLGTGITDTRPEDWSQPGQDFRPEGEEKLTQDDEALEEVLLDNIAAAQPAHGADSGDKSISDSLAKRPDGKYEEILGGAWTAEYAEESSTGLWGAEVFKRDVSEWRASGYESLEAARQSVQEFYHQV